MIWEEQVAQVVQLACLTEERTPAEQRALLRVAHKIDQELNRQTVCNSVAERYFWHPSRLGRLAGCEVAGCKVCSKWPDRTWLDDPVPVNAVTLSHVGREE